jgi:TRAP-type C4-dicarboxylate transport system permease small subunit
MVRSLERLLGYVAASGLFGMMLLTFADVVGRKFVVSIPGSLEITELLMLVVIFVGLPLASLKGEHVFFDLLDQFLPEGLRKVQAALANAICAALLLGAAWLVWGRAARTAGQGDITAQLQIPVAPFHYMAACLLLLTAVMHLVLMFRPPIPAMHVPPPEAR